MSKMPTDRNRRHEELLRRAGIPMPGHSETDRERAAREDRAALDPLHALLPPPEIPSPPKPHRPKSGR